MRGVHGVKRDVEEQRLALVALADEPRGLLGVQVRAVTLVAALLVVAVPVETAVADVGEVIECAVVVAVLMVEAAAGRQILRPEMAEVPFAANRRLVADFFQSLWQRPL